MSESKTDYKVIQKQENEFQKLLNQWEHTYDLDFIKINMSKDNNGVIQCYAIIKRTKK